MLKIFEKPPDGGEPVSYLFHFNSSSDPRAEANAVKDVLSQLIANAKSTDSSVPRVSSAAATNGDGAGSGSAAMAFASTAAGAAGARAGAPRAMDDDELISL